jgi:sporulation related protein
MTTPATERGFDWEAAGLGLGESLNLHHTIVVVGHNPEQTGQVALGIARAQSAHRRVTLGDLFADSPPIQHLVNDEEAHGLVEAISYGISLARVTRPVAGSTRLFVIPSGSEPPDYQELLSNPRWTRVASEARATASLIVLVAPGGAPGIADLVALTDGVVVVGDAIPAGVEASSVVAMLRESRPVAAAKEHRPSRAVAVKRRQFKVTSMPGIALLSLIVILVGWLAYRPLAGGPARLGPKPDTVNHRVIPAPIAVQPANPGDRVDTAAIDAPYMVANPGDSLSAAAFAVELVAANTPSGAILKLQQDGNNVPTETFSPAQVQGATWYKVVSGAYATRAQADSLLRALRQHKLLDRSSGTVVRLPFAFLIDSGLPPSAVPGVISMWGYRGQPAYALQQSNGSAWLLVGAFESVGQSALAVPSLRAAGIKPLLVYRKGRSF